MSIKNIFTNKKIFLDIKNDKIRNLLIDFFKKENIVQNQDDADFRISDIDKEGFIKVGSIFSFSFIKDIRDLDKIGIYKNIYFHFNFPIFRDIYEKVLFYIFFFVVLFFPFVKYPVPPDDLLRHLIVYRYDYDYSKIFINSIMPEWNFYLPFDIIAGEIHRFFSFIPIDSIKIYGPFFVFYYIFAFLSFYAVKINTRKFPKIYLIFFFSLFLNLSLSRFFLERPTSLATLFFLISLGFFIKKKEKIALLFASLISIFYYLFFIYLIPLLFFSRKILFIFIIGFIYWSLLAYLNDGFYFKDIYTYILSLDKKDLFAGENKSFFSIIANPLVMLIIICVVLYFYKANKKYLYPSFWFVLSNQIRYMEVIGPLLLFSIQREIAFFLKKHLKGSFLAIFILSLSLFLHSYLDIYSNNKTPSRFVCKELQGHKVKTLLGGNFFLVYFCEDVKVNPAMEIRWSLDKKLEKDILKGNLDCRYKGIYEYDYLYENTLNGNFKCLEFIYKDGNYTLWKIKDEK